MSQNQGDDGKQSSDNGQYVDLLNQVQILLEHLQRINDNRLLAHFKDTQPPDLGDPRLRLAAGIGIVALPPCEKYAEFLMRLGRMKPDRMSDEESGDPKLSDLAFLRWSLDFLAALAAPASAESVAMTRAYIQTRVRWANDSWWQWLKRALKWLSDSPRRGPDPQWGNSERIRRTALWLARSVCWLEVLAITFGIVAVVLSAYAMVGRLIANDESNAFAAFSKTMQAIDKERRALASPTNLGIAGELRFEGIDAPTQDNPRQDCPKSFDWTPVETVLNNASAATRVAQLADPDPLTPAQDMVMQCVTWQWNLTALVNDNLRLREWENAYLVFPVLKALAGWDADAINDYGGMLETEFCRRLKSAYRYQPSASCGNVLVKVAHDSGSLANSIQLMVGQSILPCLYALIGAAAATMLYLRRQTDRSLLSYTDRGRIQYNLILGFVFGAVIALVAGFIPGGSETGPAQPSGLMNGLGLSALALLAGYNVSAVFDFLDAVSRRVFNASEQQTPAARAAQR